MFDVLFLQCSIINWDSIKQLQMIWLNVTPCPRGTYLTTSFLKMVENNWIIVFCLWWHIHKSGTFLCWGKSTLYVTSWYPQHWYDCMCLLLALCVEQISGMRKLLLCRKEEVGTFISTYCKCNYRICISPSASWSELCPKGESHHHCHVH